MQFAMPWLTSDRFRLQPLPVLGRAVFLRTRTLLPHVRYCVPACDRSPLGRTATSLLRLLFTASQFFIPELLTFGRLSDIRSISGRRTAELVWFFSHYLFQRCRFLSPTVVRQYVRGLHVLPRTSPARLRVLMTGTTASVTWCCRSSVCVIATCDAYLLHFTAVAHFAWTSGTSCLISAVTLCSHGFDPPVSLQAHTPSLVYVSAFTAMCGVLLRSLRRGSGEHCAPDSCSSTHLHCCRNTGLLRCYRSSLTPALLTALRAVSLSHSVFRSDSIRITRSKSPDAFASGRHISLQIMCCVW